MNSKAAELIKNGRLIDAVALYSVLFDRAKRNNLTHPELYICHGNCSTAYLKLHLYEKAMYHAEKSAKLAETSLRRCGVEKEW